jgi:hypothetical protein
MLNQGISTEKINGYMFYYESDLSEKFISKDYFLSSNV